MRFGLRLRFWAFSHQESIETRDLKRTRRITYLGCVRGPGRIDSPKAQMALYRSTEPFGNRVLSCWSC